MGTRSRREQQRPAGFDWNVVRQELYGRQIGVCLGCGQRLGSELVVCHHRRARSQGGLDELANLVLLHDSCHKWVHDHVTVARDHFLIVPSWADPIDSLPHVIDELRELYKKEHR